MSDYAFKRNFDLQNHNNVSQLSPYICYRAISEEEVLRTVFGKHPYEKIQKFVDEVFWRTYWKGWLEQRPQVWEWYKADLKKHHKNWPEGYDAAIKGKTNIDCFNHWTQELVETGYLHNHARMWFASIWIFTLKLPWQLGADFFLQNLLDGDAASNTLSWRWVAGVQTKGKTYLARADNIEKYTEGRFKPEGLADEATAFKEDYDMPDAQMPDLNFDIPRDGKVGLLITEEDVSATNWLGDNFDAIAAINLSRFKSPNGINDLVDRHVNACLSDHEQINDINQWKDDHNLHHIVTAYTPVGHVRDYLDDFDITYITKKYDATCWPYATKGFFKFKKQIPELIGELNLD